MRARCESVNFARRGWVFWVRMLQSAIYSKIDFLTVTLCRRGSQGCQAFHHSTQVANKSWTFAATGISAVMSSEVSVVISRGCQFLAGDCSNHFFVGGRCFVQTLSSIISPHRGGCIHRTMSASRIKTNCRCFHFC